MGVADGLRMRERRTGACCAPYPFPATTVSSFAAAARAGEGGPGVGTGGANCGPGKPARSGLLRAGVDAARGRHSRMAVAVDCRAARGGFGWAAGCVDWPIRKIKKAVRSCDRTAGAEQKSGWRDLNPRPLAPQASALARLRHIPVRLPLATDRRSGCAVHSLARCRWWGPNLIGAVDLEDSLSREALGRRRPDL